VGIRDLAVDHPYYCSDSNWYDRTAGVQFTSWRGFHDAYAESDEDLNLVFRWDVKEREDDDGIGLGVFSMELFVMQQRRGKFVPIWIEVVRDEDEASIREYLAKKWEHMRVLWSPVSGDVASVT
jgi:hypothetical protein